MADVLDAFALVALTFNEPAAAEVEATLRRGDCVMSAINLAETIDRLGRVHGVSGPDLTSRIGAAIGDQLRIAPVEEATAWRAAELRRRHYRRSDSALSLADCFALATAGPDDRLVTADPPLLRAAREEGIEVLALPDSSGRRA